MKPWLLKVLQPTQEVRFYASYLFLQLHIIAARRILHAIRPSQRLQPQAQLHEPSATSHIQEELPIEEEMPEERQAEEEPMMEYDECCGGDDDLNRAMDESRAAAPPTNRPAQNLHWIPRLIAGRQFAQLNKGNIKCAICLYDITEGDIYATCSGDSPHLFHTTCLRRWLRTNNTCPTCRAVIDYKTAPSWWEPEESAAATTSSASKQQEEKMETGEEIEIKDEDVFLMRAYALFRQRVDRGNDPEIAARLILIDIDELLRGREVPGYDPPIPNDITGSSTIFVLIFTFSISRSSS